VGSTLAKGLRHPLLRRAGPSAAGAITIGFSASGGMTIAGDGTPATRSLPGALGTIGVGDPYRALAAPSPPRTKGE
jgi:hypothetical protein